MGDIILTTSEAERDRAVAAGYRSDGTIGHLYPFPDEREVLLANHGFVDEGVECHVFHRPVSASQATVLGGTPVPLHAMRSTINGEHFYTTDAAERDRAVSAFGYASIGVACWVFTQPATDTVPLYRCWHSGRFDHLYTTDAAERDQAVANGYTDEGVAAHVYPTARTLAPESPVPLVRTVNPLTGDHYYALSRLTTPLVRLADTAGTSHRHTASAAEWANASSSGYADDGVVGYLFPETRAGAVALNRFTSPDGQQFVSPYAVEQAYLVSTLKYVRKDTAGWILDSPRPGTAPLYRLTTGFDTGKLCAMTADLRLSINSVGQFTCAGLRFATFVAPDRTDLTPPTPTLTFTRDGSSLGAISGARKLVFTITRVDTATYDKTSRSLSVRMTGTFRDPDGLSAPTIAGREDLSVFALTTGTADQRTDESALTGVPVLRDGRFTLVARGWVTASAEIRSARASLTWNGTFDPVP